MRYTCVHFECEMSKSVSLRLRRVYNFDNALLSRVSSCMKKSKISKKEIVEGDKGKSETAFGAVMLGAVDHSFSAQVARARGCLGLLSSLVRRAIAEIWRE